MNLHDHGKELSKAHSQKHAWLIDIIEKPVFMNGFE
jgi:hypothetical protein